MQKQGKYIIGTLGLYFGWVLSFPFYGPVMGVAETLPHVNGFSMAIIFSCFHAFSLILGGILLKNTKFWKQIMLGSLAATIAANAALFLPFPGIWTPGMAVMGCSSAAFILGWSCPYSLALPKEGRIKIMACTIICSNLVFILFNLLGHLLSGPVMLAAAIIPLGGVLAILIRLPSSAGGDLPASKSLPLPAPLLVIFSLFAAVLYLNGGFMYYIMLPSLDTGFPLLSYYRFIPYILVLLVMYWFGERLQYYFSLYMGVSLLGLAFVSFALLDNTVAGFLMTVGLIEPAFALLDLFIWTTLGSLAFMYRSPIRFFGLALGAMVTSILIGNLIGEQLIRIGETHRLVTAVLAATTIFIAFTVMPWLNERISPGFSLLRDEPDPGQNDRYETILERLFKHILPEQKLTNREKEILDLILKGLTNRDIAQHLFISQNTLKTHLKNIYQKFGVKQKRELLSLAAGSGSSRKQQQNSLSPVNRNQTGFSGDRF